MELRVKEIDWLMVTKLPKYNSIDQSKETIRK